MYGRGTTSSLVSIGKVNKTFKETELQQENTAKERFALFKLQMLRQAKGRKGFDQIEGKLLVKVAMCIMHSPCLSSW